LNLRPPGPQPEGWGAAQLLGPVFVGLVALEPLSVALNLFPKLFPEHVFAHEKAVNSEHNEEFARNRASVVRTGYASRRARKHIIVGGSLESHPGFRVHIVRSEASMSEATCKAVTKAPAVPTGGGRRGSCVCVSKRRE